VRAGQAIANSWVCEDSCTSEKADVCEAPLELGGIPAPVCTGGRRGGKGSGAGIAPASPTGCAECGASVEIACEPGENHTSTFSNPVLRIENIRTSKYDRCSDT
jgi:hypothetical protein